jgi:hypothetical protein
VVIYIQKIVLTAVKVKESLTEEDLRVMHIHMDKVSLLEE